MSRLIFLLATLLAAIANAADRPNLVFIIADDMTFREIGCYGGQAHTPHIDKLATQGMQFSHCFQSAPMCSPTRHNIYTGIYPVRSGAYPNHTYAKPDTKSIVHYLKPLGYRVALSGKTHIGPKSVFPFEYSGKKNPDMQAIDKMFAECQESKTPVCLFACSNEPHAPWDKGDASRYPADQIKLPPYIVDNPILRKHFSDYLAEITYFDDQVGEILALIDKHNMADNTLVIVVSEQGNQFPFAKWTCYDHGLQSAMIARWPGKIATDSKTDALVEFCDITPTFVDAAGGTPADAIEGASFLDVLTGKRQSHKDYSYALMTTRGINAGSDLYPIRSVRDHRYRLIWNLKPKTKFTNVCSTADYFKAMERMASDGDENAKTLVNRYLYRPEWELFDTEADPMESKNLADSDDHAHITARLKGKLQTWMKQQGDLGIETERMAPARQTRYQKMPPEDAVKAFEANGGRKKKKAA